MKQILESVAILHKSGYAHRDIKSDNFVFRDELNRELVLIDFGDCKLVNEDSFMSDFVGSIMYLAPETFRPRRELELFGSDIWAIGCLTYQLICGNTPFIGTTHREIISQILKSGKDDFVLKFKRHINNENTESKESKENKENKETSGDSEKKNDNNKEKEKENKKNEEIKEKEKMFEEIDVSADCRDFVEKCLKYYSSDRMTIDNCLEHRWIVKNVGRSPMIGTPSCATHQKSTAFTFPVAVTLYFCFWIILAQRCLHFFLCLFLYLLFMIDFFYGLLGQRYFIKKFGQNEVSFW